MVLRSRQEAGLAVLILACLAVPPTGALADLTNESFELHNAAKGHLRGWSFTDGSVNGVKTFTDGTTNWGPPDGNWFAVLTPTTTGNVTLSQQFTVQSLDDTLTFDYFWDKGTRATGSQYAVSGEGFVLQNGTRVGGYLFQFRNGPAYTDTSWMSFSETVGTLGLTPGQYTLRFRITDDLNTTQSHLGIDDVHVVAVPVPAAVLLGLLGLSAAGIGLRKSA
jgi:hypothetical protein